MTRVWRHVTSPLKARIVGLWDKGETTHRIAALVGRHKNVVHNVIKEARPEARLTKRYGPRPITVWTPDLNEEVRRLWNTGQWTAREIAEAVNAKRGTSLTRNAVNSRMRQEGLPHPSRARHEDQT